MIHAYDEVYLEKARVSLGRMLDYGVYDLKYDIAEFFDLFIQSGLAKDFARGVSKYLVGMSGVELAYETLYRLHGTMDFPKPNYTQNRSEEYWTGWALAYYQWYTSLDFEDILRYIPIEEIQSMYSPYHEMDILQFVDRMNELMKERKQTTNLKLRRLAAEISQKDLAALTGIPVRTIQQYEQRQKNINKASSEYLIAFSKALYCEPSELLENHQGKS